MTKERVCANDIPRPVTDAENESVKGQALCHESVLQDHLAAVQALRAKQRAYLETLPTDPDEVVRAALKVMNPKGYRYPEGFEDALHIAHGLAFLIEHGEIEEGGFDRESARYLANTMVVNLRACRRRFDHLTDILGGPSRAKREGAN